MKRAFAAVVVLSLTLAGAALAPVSAEVSGAAAGVPAGTRQVTPDGMASVRDGVSPLAGSPHWLIYTSQPTVADAALDPNDPPGPAPNAELRARSATGRDVDLGRLPRTELIRWSASGAVAVAAPASTSYGVPTNVVRVWSLSTRQHRVVTLPPGDLLMAATPTGFIDVAGDGLQLRSRRGTVLDSVRPFPGHVPLSVASDDQRYVVNDAAGDIAYATFAAPGDFHALDGGSGADGQCTAVDSQGALCGGTFFPLDGGPAMPTPGRASSTALSRSTVLWTDDSSDETHLWSRSPDGSVQESTDLVSFELVTAYGDAVFTGFSGPASQEVFRASAADRVRRLFRAPRSPGTAGTFALTTHRVAYVSSLRKLSDPKQLTSLRSTEVSATPSAVHLGSSRTLAGRQGDYQVETSAESGSGQSLVAASGATTVFMRCQQPARYPCRLAAISGGRTRTLASGVNRTFVTQAAGHTVLVWRPGARNVRLYDARTGGSHKVLDRPGLRSVALAGDHLAYGVKDGRVYWLDLRSGQTRLVFRPQVRHFLDVTVVARGNLVAWHLERLGANAPGIDAMRDMRGGAIRRLPHPVYGVGGGGALMQVAASAADVTRTWFARMHGKVRTLLAPRGYGELPQVAGHAVAWVSVDGNLKVAPFGD